MRRFLQGLLSGMVLLCLCAGALQAASSLPKKARDAINKKFPKAKIKGVDKEKEFGALYYEVEIYHEKRNKEVEVSPDGIIGEVEYTVKLAEVPKEVAATIKEKLAGAKIRKIERHERYGTAKSGKWESLKEPTLFFDVKYRKNGKNRSMLIRHSGKESKDPDDPDEGKDDDDDKDDDKDDD